MRHTWPSLICENRRKCRSKSITEQLKLGILPKRLQLISLLIVTFLLSDCDILPKQGNYILRVLTPNRLQLTPLYFSTPLKESRQTETTRVFNQGPFRGPLLNQSAHPPFGNPFNGHSWRPKHVVMISRLRVGSSMSVAIFAPKL